MTAFKKICICGGGNAAHVFLGLLHQEGVEVSMFVPFGEEAERWQECVDGECGMVLEMPGGVEVGGVRPVRVSKEAADVVPDCDAVILPIPAFALLPTLEAVAPHLKEGAAIGAFPGNSGWHWQAQRHLYEGLGRRDVVIFGTNQLPLNCRWLEYAKRAKCLATKKAVAVGAVPAERVGDMARALAATLPAIRFLEEPHFLGVCLYPANQLIHGCRLYDLFRDWSPGDRIAEAPMFYSTVTDGTAALMTAVSDELRTVARHIEERQPALRLSQAVHDIHRAMRLYYGSLIEDDSTLRGCFTTNEGYVGLTAPMAPAPDDPSNLQPDFGNRYFSEDIPHGLCLAKGIAEVMDVPTPTIDTIILWAQHHMGKQFLHPDSHRLSDGADMKECSCPQNFGKVTFEDLIA